MVGSAVGSHRMEGRGNDRPLEAGSASVELCSLYRSPPAPVDPDAPERTAVLATVKKWAWKCLCVLSHLATAILDAPAGGSHERRGSGGKDGLR